MAPKKAIVLPPGPERVIYEVIHDKREMGIWMADIRSLTKLTQPIINKALKALQFKSLITDVVDIRNKKRKTFISTSFIPSATLTGGGWYNAAGDLDTEFINILRGLCRRFIDGQRVTTSDAIAEHLSKSEVVKMELSGGQVREILEAMVLEREVEECRSSGDGEFEGIMRGKLCYRSMKGREGKGRGLFASVPCGVCPRIAECSPGGIVSPETCEFYNKWLDLQF